MGLCWWLSSKEFACNAGDTGDIGSISALGRSPGIGNGNSLQYSCLEKFYGQRSLVGYSPGGLQSAVKVLHSICQQICKAQQWPQDWERSLFITIPKRGNAKEFSNYHTIVLISHASMVMLKILQARLQQYVNQELPDVQVGFSKGRGTRDQTANIHWIIKKQEDSRKTSTSASLTMLKLLTVWITTDCVKFFKKWEC